MMTAGRRGSRAAAILLLVALLTALVASALVPAALRWNKLGAQILSSRAQVNDAAQSAGAQEALFRAEERWTDFRQRDAAGFVDTSLADLPEATEVLLNDVVESFGGGVRSLSVIPLMEFPGAVTASLTAELPRAAIMPFLFAIESKPPFVILDQMSVSREVNGRAILSIEGSAFGQIEGAQQ